MFVDEADAPNAEPQGRVEAAQPLKMDMAGGDRGGFDAFQGVIDFCTRSGRQDDVLVRLRRRVAAEDLLDVDRRLEAAEKLETFGAKLFARPASGFEQTLLSLLVLDRLVAEVEGQEEVVRVPEHAWAVELTQQLDALERLRPALRDIAEGNDQVDVVLLQIGESRPEGDCIAVHVGEKRDSHSTELTGTP